MGLNQQQQGILCKMLHFTKVVILQKKTALHLNWAKLVNNHSGDFFYYLIYKLLEHLESCDIL